MPSTSWRRCSRRKRNFTNALKLAVYSFTPVWLIGIVLMVPGLRFLSILGLYAIRLIWTGLPPLMGTPRPKVLPYAISIVVAAFGIVLAMSVIQAAITDAAVPGRRGLTTKITAALSDSGSAGRP